MLLLSAHFDTAVRRAPRRRSGSQGRYHPPVELGVEHGQRREDARLDPREGDDGPSRAGLGEAVVVVIFSFVFFVFRKLKKSESFSLLVLLCQGREISFRFVAPPPLAPFEKTPTMSASKTNTNDEGKKNSGEKKKKKNSRGLRRPRRVERKHDGRNGPPPRQRRARRPLEPEPRLHPGAPHERHGEGGEDGGRRDCVGEGAGRGARAGAVGRRDGDGDGFEAADAADDDAAAAAIAATTSGDPAANDDAVPARAQEAGAESPEAELDDGGDGEGEEDLERGEDGGGGGKPSRGSRLRRRGGRGRRRDRWRHLFSLFSISLFRPREVSFLLSCFLGSRKASSQGRDARMESKATVANAKGSGSERGEIKKNGKSENSMPFSLFFVAEKKINDICSPPTHQPSRARRPAAPSSPIQLPRRRRRQRQ